MTAPTGARIGIDVGTVRIGVALAPAGAGLAVPLSTVPRGMGDLGHLTTLIRDHSAVCVYVGDPLTLSGAAGPAATAVREFARELANHVPDVPVRLVDERLTTAESGKRMRDVGRNTRDARNLLDQAAAVSILQNAVDVERATGQPAGATVERDG